MADINKTVSIIFQAEDKTYPTLPGLEKNLNALGNEAGGASTKVGKLGDEVEGLAKKGAGIDGLVLGLKTLAAGLVVKEFIDANVAAEKFRLTLTASTGSAAAAAAELEYVRAVSQRLGIETRSTAEAYAGFAAATKGSALEGQGARTIFEAIAGTMSAMGRSSADTSGALVQLSQGISKGKFELEDLKSIAERVPGFFTTFADALGITTGELFKLISQGRITGAEILILADKLNAGLNGMQFDGFTQSLARFRNGLEAAYTNIGNAGVFDTLIKGLQLGTAAIVGAQAAIVLLGETWANWALTVKTGDFSGFGDRLSESIDKAANSTRAARDALLGTDEAAAKAGAAGEEAGKRLSYGMSEARRDAFVLAEATKQVDAELQKLGIDPKKIKEPLADLAATFQALATNPAVRGDQILAGLKATLKQVTESGDLNKIGPVLVEAMMRGTLSAGQFSEATKLLGKEQQDLAGKMPKVSDAAKLQATELKNQADEMKRAEDKAQAFRLEMEKLASNERIKNIEARVTLNIENLKAQTERIKAAFSSVDNAVNSTGKLIGDLFGLFKDEGSLSWGALSKIDKQIDRENKLRDDAFKLQKDLTQAQIDQMRAQTNALLKGDGLIKIDAAGLEPALEMVLWEILRKIQVRVNAQGLSMLLGV